MAKDDTTRIATQIGEHMLAAHQLEHVIMDRGKKRQGKRKGRKAARKTSRSY